MAVLKESTLDDNLSFKMLKYIFEIIEPTLVCSFGKGYLLESNKVRPTPGLVS